MLFPFSILLLLTLLFASDQSDQILSQFSQAMTQAMAQATNTSHPCCNPLLELLERLCNSRSQSKQLTEMAYGWCSVICENYSILEDAEDLLLLSLETGFRLVDPRKSIEATLIHTKHHQKLASIVFNSGDGEAIADLLCAWTSESDFHKPYPQLKICVEHLIGLLHYIPPFSPRFQSHIMNAIEYIGYQQFEQVGAEEFIRLLNDLGAYSGDQFGGLGWTRLLLDTIKSSKEVQHLSHPYWRLLVNRAAYWSGELEAGTYSPHPMVLLEGAKEWNKLKYWIITVWLVWPPEGGETTEEDLENVMLSLFYQQPSILQELEEEIEQWSKECPWIWIPDSFEQTCKKAYDKASQQVIL